ncbi:hypothetical protein SCHPADRAFT_970312 [Schizopora paradoxa]|uniref:Uncharacterized protein n=1 Tax=Schizopora paradoxa TaxID=27342 RepID=A0A0H2RUR1_9AGAM|nr:hypothetical protein SCHPADRAFT_970312 [Schizopora paradoxa]
MFLLDMLDNLPRLRLSDSQLRAVLFVMKESGAKDVPSFDTLRRRQKAFRKFSVPTERKESAKGNVFYVNDIHAQVAQDFANPLVRPFIGLYPELNSDGIVSEAIHGEKLRTMDPDKVTPMAIGRKKRHFYVSELALCCDKRLVIPLRWIIRDKELTGDCFTVTRFTVNTDIASQMPNPIRARADGKPFYVIQLRLWGDDVSGNKSKQWNKHWFWCFVYALLPKKLMNQEYFVRYICCSPHAPVLEQAEAICEAIKSSNDGFIAFDALENDKAFLKLNVYYESGDNPMLSEACSHIGLGGNRFCYRCHVGGTGVEKMSEKGYHLLFQPGAPRTVFETRKEVFSQWRLFKFGGNVGEAQTNTGVKDSVLQSWADTLEQSGTGGEGTITAESVIAKLKPAPGYFNPFLDLPGFDPHRDGPVEPLHTVSLGIIKYIWALTCASLNQQKNMGVFQSRLESVNVDGLNIPPLRVGYLVQYRGSLIGRQFKSLVQVMSFVLYGLVSDEMVHLWVAAGHLTSYLWFTEIKDVPRYCSELEGLIGQFLDSLSAVEPGRIVAKPKCHILTHSPDDVRRLGPAAGLFGTDTFECFNGVFRLCSILSNHQAPSLDIARTFSELGFFKQIASGGYWKDREEWVRAGPEVRKFMNVHTEVQDLLGWASSSRFNPGYIQRPPKKKSVISKWESLQASKAIPYFIAAPNDQFTRSAVKCLSFVSVSGDVCKEGCFVVGANSEPSIGRIVEILQSTERDATPREVVVLEKYYVGGQHARLRMPTLHRESDRGSAANESNVQFIINAQHDCERADCNEIVTRVEKQEREATSRTIAQIEHRNFDHFVINIHSLHNAHRIRELVDTPLYSIPALSENREQLHASFAQKLRNTKNEKTEITREKRRVAAEIKSRLGKGKEVSTINKDNDDTASRK